MKGVYALTGGIACGKSTVSRMLVKFGAQVVDADCTAREVVQPGQAALAEIKDVFGPEVIKSDGTLDRPALGSIVFQSGEALRQLEAITHPRIEIRSSELLREALERPYRPVFYDSALIVEFGMQNRYDGLLVVSCSPEVQLRRLQARDKNGLEDAQRRIAAQLPLSEKEAVADYVIHNNGTRKQLEDQVLAVLSELR